MEILRSLNLEDEVKQAGEALKKSRYMLFVESLAGREERRIADDDLMMQGDALAKYTPCTWVQCAQNVLENLLAERAIASGAEFAFGTRLTSLTQDENRVLCTVSLPDGGADTIEAKYLIACDGARSTVRQQLGIELDGRAAIEHFVNIYFEADLKSLVEGRWFGICFVENSDLQGLFLPVDNDRRWLLNVQYDADKETADSFTIERCTNLVQAAIGDPTIPLKVLSALPWVASSRAAPRLRSGRVFLAGDAGHILPPAGGFGLNLAVQDAHNLAWKLAGVLRSSLDAAALDSYEAERLPAAACVARYSEDEIDADQPWKHGDDGGQDGSPSPGDRVGGERGGDDDDLGEQGGEHGGGMHPWEQSLEQQLEAVIGFRYRSALTSESYAPEGLALDAAPGTRFPHVFMREGVSTLDCLPHEFCLCVPENNLTDRATGQLAPVTFPQDIWKRIIGQHNPEAILVRPDGIVAASGSVDEVVGFYNGLAPKA
jgi:2-polyprenyl-6-methoxyphenol hydroxylase-like FAD-dependent oxidoreductase